jgi:hypothetical protein
MTDLSNSGLGLTTIAHLEARAAVGRDARQSGVTVTPPTWPGPAYYTATSGIAEPLAGLRLARDRAWAAQSVIKEYIYHARQAGHSWEAIGHALDLDGEADPAVAAFEYAIAPITRPFVPTDTFSWICPECQERIADRGPATDEPGHDPARPRLVSPERSTQ